MLPIYEGQTTLGVLMSRLADLGYGMTGMFPVSRDRSGLRVIEFDCVMSRIDGS